ncbi:hypothetical protein JW935_28290, partial [candidate division KSB1 bacterium]|nr:hypothetical protein [candidate division KSB1 bacterium]
MKKRVVNIGGENVEIPAFSGRFIIYIIIGIFVLLMVYSMLYTIDADEVGVIRRLGAYNRTTDPGLH